MAYTKTRWKDKTIERPRTFTIQNNPDGTATLIPVEGTVYEPGTPVNAANLNKIETGVEDANNEKASTVAALKRALQSFQASQTGLAFPTIYGRTLVNLLGRDGNCESLTPFLTSGTVALSTAQKKSGDNSLKVTTSSSAGFAYKDYTYTLDTSKQYVLGAWVFIESISAGSLSVRLWDVGGFTSVRYAAAVNTGVIGSWQFVYVKIPTSHTIVGNGFRIQIGSTGATNTFVAYFDEIRLYEVSVADFTAIGTTYTATTSPSIDDVIPYVDGIQHVTNPVLTKLGRNLLPPFTEWTLHANAVATEPYKLTLNATASNQYTNVTIPVTPLTTYTMQCVMNGGKFDIDFHDINGVITTGDPSSISGSGLITQTFTTTASTYYVRVHLASNAAGTFTFSNPMLIIGTAADLPPSFEPRNDDYVYGVADSAGRPLMLASNIDGSVRDSLTVRDNVGVKFKRFEMLDLTGSLTWVFVTDYVGYKDVQVQLPTATGVVSSTSSKIMKYDGSVLKYGSSSVGPDYHSWHSSGNYIYVSIADANSGWGESYTPTAAEIQAYFNGWKMYEVSGGHNSTYNGTGTKAWVERHLIGSGSAGTSDWSFVNGRYAWGGTFTPYKLTYQLAKSIEEVVTTEGAITLQQGQNALELGEGVVVREKVTPVLNSGYYEINRNGLSSQLKNRTNNILAIMKNGQLDKKWRIKKNDSVSYWYGGSGAEILASGYDQTAEYTVTYMPLDKYGITANVIDATLEHWPNVGSAEAVNARTIADMFPIIGGLRAFINSIYASILKLGTDKANLSSAAFSGPISAPSVSVTQANDSILELEDTSAPNTSYRKKRVFSSKNVSGGNDWLFRQIRPSDGAIQDFILKGDAGASQYIWTSAELRTTSGYLEVLIGGTWRPVGGVKNIQRGTSALGNVTIAAVNMAKTLVVISYTGGNTNAAVDLADSPNVKAELTSSTNLSLTATGPVSTANISVAWQVVEYY